MGTWTRRHFLNTLGAASGAVAISSRTVASIVTQRQSQRPLAFKTAVELARMIREKEISSVELTRYFIQRIERHDTTLNAVVVRDFDRALAAAARADRLLAQGQLAGPLHGLPMTIKESYDIAGLATTWGNPSLKGNIATRDSTVVERCKGAGAHFLGKTNVPLLLSDFQSYNASYGQTNNPWDLERTPGGSSGGTAAALAAGLTALCSGSDIGSSIRNPAHYCGIYGHKPTYGVVSGRGHSVPAYTAPPDLAVVGPLARSAGDLALAMDVMAGANELQSPGWKLELPPPRAGALKDCKVAVWPNDLNSEVDDEIASRISNIADRLDRLGATVSDTARPEFSAAEANHVYLTLLRSFLSVGTTDEAFEQQKRQAARFDASDQSPDATMARAAVLDHRTWLHYHNRRTELRRQWKRFFSDWDVLLCPTVATTAFKHDHRPFPERTLTVNGREVPYFEQLFWAGLATCGNLPTTVLPTGLSRAGLPIGVQVIGAEFHDRTTIEFARLMAAEFGGFTPPPGYET